MTRLLCRWLLLSSTSASSTSSAAGVAAASARRRLLHAGWRGGGGNGRPATLLALRRRQHHPTRGLASAPLRAAARLLRLRYLLAAGTAGGGVALTKKYEEIKASMPDLGRLRQYLPAEESVDAFVHALQSCGRLLQLPERGWLRNSVTNLKTWIRQPGSGDSSGADASSSSPFGFFLSPADAAAQQDEEAERLQEQLVELQSRYQREAESLEAEARDLRRQLASLRLASSGGSSPRRRSARKSLIDLYSEVLDALSERDAKFSAADHLPRVVVVGDQSAGKTSVLEMVARARIFPRGAGEMMTRAPVQVTLSEGPYHIARFKDNPAREFDLTQEAELAALRDAIERRMRSAVQSEGGTVSTDAISLAVQGPGLPRMVLVDLPGIISTETAGMAAQTRESICRLAAQHMRNPNAIILCVADACVDPERSNAIDLVARQDPSGRRTIFVLTKLDLAERDKVSPERVSKLLAGRLLPLKALGYFAVVTGGGNGTDDTIEAIQRHEAEFFRNSRLFREGKLSLAQVTAANMAQAVSRRFWALVRESVEAQADALKALRFNLETEWKHQFPGRRQCSRTELFEKARSDLLDEVIALSALPAEHWEDAFRSALSGPLLSHALELLLEAGTSSGGSPAELQTRLDIALRQWAESTLPSQSVATGWSVLYQQLDVLPRRESERDPVLEPLQATVRSEARKGHQWDPKAEGALRVLQVAALDERSVPTRADWDAACGLLRRALEQRLAETEAELARACGPTAWQRWTGWRQRPTAAQERLARLVRTLRTVAGTKEVAEFVSPDLSAADVAAAKRSLAEQGTEGVDEAELRSAWPLVQRQLALRAGLDVCGQCSKMYYHYQQRLPTAAACHAVPYFYRVGRMLDATSSALRQQAVNNEAHRLERAVKCALAAWADDPSRLRQALRGRSVQLAEDIQGLRAAEEKLDQFIEALNSTPASNGGEARRPAR